MARFPIDPYDQRSVVRALMGEVEAIRYRRYDQWHDRPHPLGKRFTQEELRDRFPNYKNWLTGRTRRLPSRALVLELAAYLECTSSETNDLLLAAEYVPMAPAFQDDEEQHTLAVAHQLLQTLPLPAFLITRGWQIAAINSHYARLAGISSFDGVPPAQRTVIHQVFAPCGLLYHGAAADNRVLYEANLRCVLRTFALPLQECQEAWYVRQLRAYHQLPHFTRLWEEVTTHSGRGPTVPTITHKSPTGVLYRTVLSIVPFAPRARALAPFIGVDMPADEAAHAIFAAVGCPITDHRWMPTRSQEDNP
ncbi:MAG: hypothetical protein ACLFVO_20125 [Chloroflexaceae bacterium]